jgi:hypothetical protein
MQIIGIALAWLKGLAFLSKIASIVAPVAGLFPGGQIVSILAATVSFLGNVIKWLWEGIMACFTHPATFLVCGCFFIGGGFLMARHDHRKLQTMKTENIALQKNLAAASASVKAWEGRYAEQEKRAVDAEKARADAERRATAAAAPAQPAAGRVRARYAPAATRPAQPTGLRLF